MRTHENADHPIYRIQVEGRLDESWSDWFSGLAITRGRRDGQDTTSTLTGPIVDQAALRGTLCRLWDLNLTLLSVVRIGRAVDEARKHSEGGST